MVARGTVPVLLPRPLRGVHSAAAKEQEAKCNNVIRQFVDAFRQLFPQNPPRQPPRRHSEPLRMMEIDTPKPQTAAPVEPPKKEAVSVTPPKDFDVDAYISNYSGHARFRRLLFLATRSKELETECLKKAIDELKKTQNAVYAAPG